MSDNISLLRGQVSRVKYWISNLAIFSPLKISVSIKAKCSDRFKDLHRLKLLTNFDVNLTSLAGVMN